MTDKEEQAHREKKVGAAAQSFGRLGIMEGLVCWLIIALGTGQGGLWK